VKSEKSDKDHDGKLLESTEEKIVSLNNELKDTIEEERKETKLNLI